MNGLRIGVVGVGHMGRRHAEKVLALRQGGAAVELVGVADAQPERARGVAGTLGVPAARDAAQLYAKADALVVAVPTIHHYDVVSGALHAGLDVLVEKPITATLEQGEALIECVRRRKRVLHVGHLEWYNAATRAIRDRIQTPRFVEVRRVGPFQGRATDVDVVRDLMIHDIDILQQLLGEEPESVQSIGVRVLTEETDIANARLRFASGCVATLTASRVAAVPVREMRLFQRNGCVFIDFLAQSAWVQRRLQAGPNGSPQVESEEVRLDPEDALLTQMRVFVDAVQRRDGQVNSAASALSALRTALRVIEAMPAPAARGGP